jgi:hypothetical protein
MDQPIPAWIQSLAAIAQVILAFVLWRTTLKYVRLTHDLSKAADKQLAFLRETDVYARRADLVDLAALCGRLKESLDELPIEGNEKGWGARLKTAPLWSSDDVRRLSALAAKTGIEFADAAAAVGNDLIWIRDQLLPVREENPGVGFHIGNFRWDEYRPRLVSAREGLGVLRGRAISACQALVAAT